MIPDKKRVYFPKNWVRWEEYFAYKPSLPSKFCAQDIESLIKNQIFTETEEMFIRMSIRGYDPIEIAEITGYGARHVHNTLQKLHGKLKNCKEVEFKPKIKWGAIGPYKRKE